MKQRHIEEPIIGILKAYEKGMTVADIYRNNGISAQKTQENFHMSERRVCRLQRQGLAVNYKRVCRPYKGCWTEHPIQEESDRTSEGARLSEMLIQTD